MPKELLERYLENLKSRKLRAAHLYILAARHFLEWLAPRKLDLSQVVPAVLNDYLLQRREPSHRPATVYAVLTRLRVLFKFAIAENLAAEDPTKEVSHVWLDVPGGLPACPPILRKLFRRPQDALRFRCRLFSPIWEEYLEHLSREGYARQTLYHIAEHVSRFHGWLEKTGARTLRGATGWRFEDHLRDLRREFRRRRGRPMPEDYIDVVRGCIGPFLAFGWRRIQSGTLRRSRPKVPSAIPDELLTEYLEFCKAHRGLSEVSVRSYRREILKLRRFLMRRKLLDLAALVPGNLDAFMMWRADERSPRSLQLVATALRSFFGYLHLSGRLSRDLAETVVSPHRYSADLRPKYLPWQRVEDILAKVDRSTEKGKRDYAILVLLACHGLRVQEVARIKLEDVDCEARRLHVHRKNGILTDLPLSDRAAEALKEYLAVRRPRPYHQVFLREYAPLRPLTNTAISTLAQAYLQEVAGFAGGGYALRHSFAKAMVDRGAKLHEVGALLGHKSLRSTQIYTRIATEDMREVADNYAAWL